MPNKLRPEDKCKKYMPLKRRYCAKGKNHAGHCATKEAVQRSREHVKARYDADPDLARKRKRESYWNNKEEQNDQV